MSDIQDNDNIEKDELLIPQNNDSEELAPQEELEVVTSEQEIEEIVSAEEQEEVTSTSPAEDMVSVRKNIVKSRTTEEKTYPTPPKEEVQEEVQELHTKHPQAEPVIDHRLLIGKLGVYNWISDLPTTSSAPEMIEVQFKNTRKGFYHNPLNIPLQKGDVVAVETALGHDIGVVSLAGELVKDQIRVKRLDVERNPLKKVYRKAKPHDIEKWQQAIEQEHNTMIRSRQIAADLRLNMKIGDVEYQGDKTKAIFYYIAEDRVDFRALIKVLAETFRIRIEMKQIGTRQEAGRIGGIGPCGRKLCCSTFITSFVSVSTSAARYQDISLNPQKLAGQCGKLKCCLNFEVDAYIDAQRDFPSTNIPLNVGDGMLYHQKTDIFARVMSYSPDKEGRSIFIPIPVKRVKEIIAMNRKGTIPARAVEENEHIPEAIKYTDGVGEDSLNRFDEKKTQKKRNNKNRNSSNNTNTRQGQSTQRNTPKPKPEEAKERRPIGKPILKVNKDTQTKNEQ